MRDMLGERDREQIIDVPSKVFSSSGLVVAVRNDQL